MSAQSRQSTDDRMGRRVCGWQMMDAGLGYAQRMRVEMQSTVEDVARFALPMWVDSGEKVRIALPVADPQHGTDVVQIIVSIEELLGAVGRAWGERPPKGDQG